MSVEYVTSGLRGGSDGASGNQPGTPRLAFGGDYNPEQGPKEILPQGVALMRHTRRQSS